MSAIVQEARQLLAQYAADLQECIESVDSAAFGTGDARFRDIENRMGACLRVWIDLADLVEAHDED